VLVVREIDRLSLSLEKQLPVEDEPKRNSVAIEYVLGEYPDTPLRQNSVDLKSRMIMTVVLLSRCMEFLGGEGSLTLKALLLSRSYRLSRHRDLGRFSCLSTAEAQCDLEVEMEIGRKFRPLSEGMIISLREEMLKTHDRTVSVAALVMTVTAAAFAASFQFRNPYILLLPLALLYFGMWVADEGYQTIVRIAVELRLAGDVHECRIRWLRRYVDETNRVLKDRVLSERGVPVALRGLAPRAPMEEHWVAGIIKTLYATVGVLCLVFFFLLSGLLRAHPLVNPVAAPDLLLPLGWNIVIGILASLVWVGALCQASRRLGQRLYREKREKTIDLWDDYDAAWRAAGNADDMEVNNRDAADAQAAVNEAVWNRYMSGGSEPMHMPRQGPSGIEPT